MQSDDHVELLTVGPGGTVTGLSARFVVGCDGGHSMIRKQSGIAFPGILNEQVVARTALVAPTEQIRPVSTDPTRTMLRGRILIEGFGEIDGIFHRTERGVIAVALSGPDHVLINTLEWEDHPAGDSPGSGAPMTLAELEASVERVLGVRIRLASPPEGSPSLLRRVCGRNTRLAERYRDRRVFLAGDAAQAAVDQARPDTAPPLVALYQATANVLRVKSSWSFSMDTAVARSDTVEQIHCRMLETCDRLFRRLRDSGSLRPDVDPVWARRVYYALIHEACQDVAAESDPDTDALATQLIDTLLRGIGTPATPL